MSNEVKISVIIPVYNLERYIERCIASVINQTLKEIEIIIVNDGSVDNSLEIINRYKEMDNRITSINQENSGVSSARNRGIEVANGKYITFVDGDDYINETMLEEMYFIAESERLDMVFCYLSNDKQNRVAETIHTTDSESCLKDMIEGKMARTASGILFNLNLIKRNKIVFETDMKYGEDFLFTINSLLKTNNRVGIIPRYLYKVEKRVGSATRTFDINRYKHISVLSRKIQNSLKNSNLDKDFDYLLNRYYGSNILSAVTNIVLSKEKTSLKLTRLREIKKSSHTNMVFKYNKFYWGSGKNKIKIFLIKYANVYFIWLFYSLYSYKRNDF